MKTLFTAVVAGGFALASQAFAADAMADAQQQASDEPALTQADVCVAMNLIYNNADGGIVITSGAVEGMRTRCEAQTGTKAVVTKNIGDVQFYPK